MKKEQDSFTLNCSNSEDEGKREKNATVMYVLASKLDQSGFLHALRGRAQIRFDRLLLLGLLYSTLFWSSFC